MGFRFRRSLRLSPRARLNVTARGPSSVSFGGRGGTVNVGRRGVTTTVGLPGTGASYSTRGVGGLAGLLALGLLFRVARAAVLGSTLARVALAAPLVVAALVWLLHAPSTEASRPGPAPHQVGRATR